MTQHIEETESLAMRVKKLAESQPVISTGMEYNGLYDLNNKSAEKYLRDHCRGNYLNIDTGKMTEIDYTVKLAIGVKNGYTYYDHALTPIDIKKLLRSIDEIKRPFASKESSINGEQASDVLSECKDSANRVKYQIYLDIFEMQPISDQRSEIRD